MRSRTLLPKGRLNPLCKFTGDLLLMGKDNNNNNDAASLGWLPPATKDLVEAVVLVLCLRSLLKMYAGNLADIQSTCSRGGQDDRATAQSLTPLSPKALACLPACLPPSLPLGTAAAVGLSIWCWS